MPMEPRMYIPSDAKADVQGQSQPVLGPYDAKNWEAQNILDKLRSQTIDDKAEEALRNAKKLLNKKQSK